MVTKECILVTGASGFVGGCLVRRLAGMGAQVHALVPVTGDLWRLRDIVPSVHVHQGDITDEAFVRDLVSDVRPTIIYHLAAHGAYPTQTDTRRMLMTNVVGTWNLLEALEKTDYKLLVNAGSSSEYGFKQTPMRETDPVEPNSYYAVTKVSQTMLCQYTARARKKPIVSFRLFSVYGSYEDPARLVPTLIRSCLQGKSLNMASPDTARDFIFVDDVVEAFLNTGPLMKAGGEIFNLASGVQVNLKQITQEALDLTKAQVPVSWNAMPGRIWDSAIWVGDVQKAKNMLGFSASTSLRQGLAKTIAWMKDHG